MESDARDTRYMSKIGYTLTTTTRRCQEFPVDTPLVTLVLQLTCGKKEKKKFGEKKNVSFCRYEAFFCG